MPIDIRAQQGLTPIESPVDSFGKIFALKNQQQQQQINQQHLQLQQEELGMRQRTYQDTQEANSMLDKALATATTRDDIKKYFVQNNKGHLWLPVSKNLDAADEAKAKVDHLQAQMGKLKDEHALAAQEWWAAQMQGLQKLPPEDWPVALPRILASAVHSGLEDEQSIRQLWGRAVEHPEEIPGVVNHLAGSSKEGLKARTAGNRPRPELGGEVLDAAGKAIPGTLVFDPSAPGNYTLDRGDGQGPQPLPPGSHVERAAPKAAGSSAEDTDVLSDLVVDGLAVPSQFSKRQINPIIAEASRKSEERTGKKLNLAQLELEYTAAKKFVTTLNDQQNINFNRLGLGIHSEIDRVQQLADQLKQGSIQLWNKAKRSTIQQVWGNTPQSELAAQYVAAVNGLQSMMAQFESGGFAPQSGGWEIAQAQLNKDYGFKDMAAALSEMKRQVGFRLKAQADARPIMPGGGTTQFTAPTPGPAGAPPPPGAPPPGAKKTVSMKAKDANGNYTRDLEVPEDRVAEMEAAGARRK